MGNLKRSPVHFKGACPYCKGPRTLGKELALESALCLQEKVCLQEEALKGLRAVVLCLQIMESHIGNSYQPK